jgi:hypothetical protein
MKSLGNAAPDAGRPTGDDRTFEIPKSISPGIIFDT